MSCTIFNGFEDAFDTSEAWPAFEPMFRDIVVFMGYKKLRSRFVAVCTHTAASAGRQVFHTFEGPRFELRF